MTPINMAEKDLVKHRWIWSVKIWQHRQNATVINGLREYLIAIQSL